MKVSRKKNQAKGVGRRRPSTQEGPQCRDSGERVLRDGGGLKRSGHKAKELIVESGVDIPFVFLTTDCPAAQQTWRDLSPGIEKVDLAGELMPAVRASLGGTKSLRQTCEI